MISRCSWTPHRTLLPLFAKSGYGPATISAPITCQNVMRLSNRANRLEVPHSIKIAAWQLCSLRMKGHWPYILSSQLGLLSITNGYLECSNQRNYTDWGDAGLHNAWSCCNPWQMLADELRQHSHNTRPLLDVTIIRVSRNLERITLHQYLKTYHSSQRSFWISVGLHWWHT